MQKQIVPTRPHALVSVIIPCFNRRDLIQETIESVLSQTYPEIEIIVVDDGSTDGSREFLAGFKNRITLLHHPGNANRGQSASINLGLCKAAGKYVAFLDSDDLFLPEKIKQQVGFLERNPQYGLVYSNGYAIDQNNHILYEIYRLGHTEESKPERVLLDCYFLVPNNSLIRKSALDKAGNFDESLRAAQDHDMAIRLSEITRIAYIDEHLFCYRRHPDSISFRNAKVRWINGYKILNKARRRYHYPFTAIFGRLAVLNFRLGQIFWEEKRCFLSICMFIASGLCNPSRALRTIIRKDPISSPH